jgi:hypothetical protein
MSTSRSVEATRRLAFALPATDADRAYAHDPKSPVGKLHKALDAATGAGRSVIDLRADLRTVFAPS